ncbi:hypothetical protein GY45DRAFT_1222576, partial [Cubamyces sp. BRFM 1775]
MLGHSKSATLALLLLFLGVVHSAPLAPQKRTLDTSVRVARDGDNLDHSVTLQTSNTIQTAVGPMLQTCTIQLDPITGDNGEPLVRETKSCSVAMTSSGNNAGSGGSNSGSSDSGSSSSADSSSATDGSASSTDTASATDSAASASPTDSNASAPATTTGAIGVNGVSQIPGSALSTGATDTASATDSGVTATATAASGGAAVSAAGFSTIDASSVATETDANSPATATPAPSGTGTAAGDLSNGSSTSATSAADTAQSSAPAFVLPGTHIQVLPIGLGIFAGISVIALIVVGLVTYERTKYRRAFRQRKLAESGAAMGYGGMA